jgi:thiamine-phosphate pyrophosphorylase
VRALPERILCLVTDLDRAGGEANMLRIVRDAVRGGVNMVQVRAHEQDESSLKAFAGEVVTVARDATQDVIVVVNGPPQVAVESGADGVHMREQSTLVRSELPSGLLAGRSVHSLQAASAANGEGVNYIILGTVFPSASHPIGPIGGCDMVSLVAQELPVAVIGIGGITAKNADQVIAAGAVGVALIGAIIGAHNSFEAARALSAGLGIEKKR